VLRDYLEIYLQGMTYFEMEQFDSEILNMENPQLQRYLFNNEPLEAHHDTKYMRALVQYVHLRKTDYAKYVPPQK
jgi:succinate dehydrogenase flavin-adding protein (antitoxin of CptAB toxin-antitoxin module)